jgi:hypothetical protein
LLNGFYRSPTHALLHRHPLPSQVDGSGKIPGQPANPRHRSQCHTRTTWDCQYATAARRAITHATPSPLPPSRCHIPHDLRGREPPPAPAPMRGLQLHYRKRFAVLPTSTAVPDKFHGNFHASSGTVVELPMELPEELALENLTELVRWCGTRRCSRSSSFDHGPRAKVCCRRVSLWRGATRACSDLCPRTVIKGAAAAAASVEAAEEDWCMVLKSSSIVVPQKFLGNS